MKPVPPPDVPPVIREKMKKAFNECYKAVVACEDDSGRKRCDLFKELPDKRARPSLYPEPTSRLTLHNQLRTTRITTKSFKLQSHCRILPPPPMGSFVPSSPSKLSRSNALFVPLSLNV